ncbi:hypothetical protein JCM6882_008049 [Rhodosporidiobolus microsporus]
MVLQDLGRRLNQAINSINTSTSIDEQSLDALLKSVSTALLESDVNVLLVKRTRERVKQKVLPQLEEIRTKAEQHGQGEQAMEGHKAKQVIQQTIFDELVSLVDPTGTSSNPEAPPPPPVFNPVKGKTQVLMMVGLQGAGKTTTCTKLATHYSRRGLKVALVCADTFRAGAFDQLKQNAVRAKVPFFGSYTETDPVTIAQQGVDKFRQARFDVIIVDTSGRHRQESELFEEMVQISEAVEPDMTLLVLDGAMGQAAEGQSRAFKEAAGFGGIVVTKLDGHAKGGGAISAVAATSTPILFLGTGEHQHDLEPFRPRPFVSKLLGLGDMQSLVERAQEMALADPGRQERMVKRLQEGVFTVRDLKEQLNTIMGMGPLSNLTSMIPGVSSLLGGPGGAGEAEASKRMKRVQFIFDSMTAEELDSDGSIFRFDTEKKKEVAVKGKGKGKAEEREKENKPAPKEEEEQDPDGLGAKEPHPRILRVARGSGTSVQEVEELLAQHQMFGKMAKRMGGKNGMLGKLAAGGGRGGMPGLGGAGGGMPPMGANGMPDLSKMSPSQMRAMQSMLPPGAREMMSRPGAMEQMQQMMSGMGGMGGLGGLANMMGGMGGGAGGGAGGMAEMMKGLMGGGGAGR